LGDLLSNRQEVGALTFNGQRIEPDLYHIGCVTMMLCHRGAIKLGKSDGSNAQIAWGASPVTRKPVDGFLRVPPLADTQKWMHFADWRGDGQLHVTELVATITSTLPVSEQVFLEFVRGNCKVQEADTISSDELETIVLPHLEQLMREVGVEDSPDVPISRSISEVSRRVSRRVVASHEESEKRSTHRGVALRCCMPVFRRRRK
jgi:hypothetical protein